MGEMFDSSVRSAGDLAGVFEYEDGSGHFYLYRTDGAANTKIVGAIQMLIEAPDFDQDDVSIRWDNQEGKVGLFIQGCLWAVFDGATGAAYGGSYRPGDTPRLPVEIARAFEAS